MKKRILFIVNSLAGGGVEKVLITLLKNFDYTRYYVELLLVYNEGVYLEEVPREVKVNYLYPKSLSIREKINYNLLAKFGIDYGYKLMMIQKRLKKYDTIVSFVHGLSLKYHSYIIKNGKKNISWVHLDLFTCHDSIGRFFSEEQEKEAYAKMDKIIFVSNDAKNQFERLYPCNITTKEVIINPIERDLIVNYRQNYKNYSFNRCFNIISVGRLNEVKAFDRLVRLAKRLKDDEYNFHITIIGEGNERKKLEKLIVENGVCEFISLPGFLKPPYEFISNADLFVLCSLAEGYPLVLCEAFCLGLPVVCTKTTGPIELIDKDKYGLLVEHNDESIYQGVKTMIEDDSLREYYHKKSLERSEIFNVEDVVNKIYTIL